jgi:hypothetical protein
MVRQKHVTEGSACSFCKNSLLQEPTHSSKTALVHSGGWNPHDLIPFTRPHLLKAQHLNSATLGRKLWAYEPLQYKSYSNTEREQLELRAFAREEVRRWKTA